MINSAGVYWATVCLTAAVAGACSDDVAARDIAGGDDAGETPGPGSTARDDSSTVGHSSSSGVSSDASTSGSSFRTNDYLDGGADTGTRSNTGAESDTLSDGAEGGGCATESAIVNLSEEESDYVVVGDEACVGNQGCMLIDVEGMYLPCGNGGYHCSACNDEVCVELYNITECSGPYQPEAGITVADAGDSGESDASDGLDASP